jgi:hypothetical protein
MQDRKYKILFALFPYGGNGDSPKEHPAIRNWMIREVCKLKANPLVEDVLWRDFNDTPITMTRNRSVLFAREVGADILVMVDSDMVPDMYLDPVYGRRSRHALDAVPFMDEALPAIHKHYDRGPIVIGAPYCGPPPNEMPYVFTWEGNTDVEVESKLVKLRAFTRNEAAQMTGIGKVAALPTGLIAFDMRAFKYVEPSNGDNGFFYYRYDDHYEAAKSGTEDVMLTRDMSLAINHHLGYEPLHCAWNSWAGHVKPWVVGKPTLMFADEVERKLAESVRHGIRSDERILDVGALDD